MTPLAISTLGWEVVPHAAYSPDLAPLGFHLFRPLKHHLREKTLDHQSDLETVMTKFFDLQLPEFWRSGIEQLPDRWGHVN